MKKYISFSLMMLANSIIIVVVASDCSDLFSKLYMSGKSNFPQLQAVINEVRATGTRSDLGYPFVSYQKTYWDKSSPLCEVVVSTREISSLCPFSYQKKETMCGNIVLCEGATVEARLHAIPQKAVLLATTFRNQGPAKDQNVRALGVLSKYFIERGYETYYHSCGRAETDRDLCASGWKRYTDQNDSFDSRLEQLFGAPYCDNLACYETTPCIFHPQQASAPSPE